MVVGRVSESPNPDDHWRYYTRIFQNHKAREWTRAMELNHVAGMLGSSAKKQRTLGVLLKELEQESKDSLCSCMPRLESNEYTALIVTCRVK